jgi:hypothetical protein
MLLEGPLIKGAASALAETLAPKKTTEAAFQYLHPYYLLRQSQGSNKLAQKLQVLSS